MQASFLYVIIFCEKFLPSQTIKARSVIILLKNMRLVPLLGFSFEL